MRTLPFAMLLTLIACGSPPNDEVAEDGGTDTCEPFDSLSCVGGDVRWLDSCGEPGEVAEECPEEDVCESAECCAVPVADAEFVGFPWTTFLGYNYAAASTDLRWTLTLNQVDLVADRPSQRLFFRGFTSADENFTVGLGTNMTFVADPTAPLGVFFELAGTTDQNRVQLGPDAKLFPIGSSLQVRKPIADATAMVELRAVREEAVAATADWYGIYLTVDGGAEVQLGRILMNRGGIIGAAPSELQSFAHTAIQVSSNEFTAEDLPTFDVTADLPRLGLVPPTRAELTYFAIEATLPVGAIFGAHRVDWDPEAGTLRFAHGASARRCGRSRTLFE